MKRFMFLIAFTLVAWFVLAPVAGAQEGEVEEEQGQPEVIEAPAEEAAEEEVEEASGEQAEAPSEEAVEEQAEQQAETPAEDAADAPSEPPAEEVSETPAEESAEVQQGTDQPAETTTMTETTTTVVMEQPMEGTMMEQGKMMDKMMEGTSAKGEVPKTGGAAIGSILLPAAALLLGSGILAYAVMRRR